MHTLPPTTTTTTSRPQSEIWGEWEEYAHATLIDTMKRRKVRYKALSSALERLGIYETPTRLNNKVNRRRFSAAFWFACLEAMDVKVALMPPSD